MTNFQVLQGDKKCMTTDIPNSFPSWTMIFWIMTYVVRESYQHFGETLSSQSSSLIMEATGSSNTVVTT
jgi:hypothetical protein